MKIIKLMFEGNLFVLKQEFIRFFESFSKVFSELVNQTSYNLFGNKPSCRQGQYQTFRLSNMLYSRIAVVCLMYCTGNRSFRLQVVSPTSRFAYIEVVSPTRPKSFRLHGLSRFAYIEVNSPSLNTYY